MTWEEGRAEERGSEEDKFVWGCMFSISISQIVSKFASGSSHPPKPKTCGFHHADTTVRAARQQTISKNWSGWCSFWPTTAAWLNSKNWHLDWFLCAITHFPQGAEPSDDGSEQVIVREHTGTAYCDITIKTEWKKQNAEKPNSSLSLAWSCAKSSSQNLQYNCMLLIWLQSKLLSSLLKKYHCYNQRQQELCIKHIKSYV